MKGGRHCAIVERTRTLLGSRRRGRRRGRRQGGAGLKDFTSYAVPVSEITGNFGREYLVDKLFEKMRRRKKQKGGALSGMLARRLGRVGLAEGIKKLDSAVQTLID